MRVGIFDSGLGGLSVLHRARKMMPEHDYIFYADEEHVPYGEKTAEQVRGYVDEIINYLISREVDIIIIACNTATSAIDREDRSRFPVPIVGMEPAVKRALDLYGGEAERILVCATPITIRGAKMDNLMKHVDVHHKVDLVALPGLVRFAEKGVFEGEEVEEYLKEALAELELERYGSVVLGCTHFNYFKNVFIKCFPHKPHFIDGNEGTIKQAMRLLDAGRNERGNKINTAEPGSVEFLFSGRPLTDKDRAFLRLCMNQLDKVFDI